MTVSCLVIVMVTVYGLILCLIIRESHNRRSANLQLAAKLSKIKELVGKLENLLVSNREHHLTKEERNIRGRSSNLTSDRNEEILHSYCDSNGGPGEGIRGSSSDVEEDHEGYVIVNCQRLSLTSNYSNPRLSLTSNRSSPQTPWTEL